MIGTVFEVDEGGENDIMLESLVKDLEDNGIRAYEEFNGTYTILRPDDQMHCLTFNWDGDNMFGLGLLDHEGVHVSDAAYYTDSQENMLQYIINSVKGSDKE